jgi:diguanylate cyclase (GGDEF)-like protein
VTNLTELQKEVERAARYRRRLSGMLIDLDDFKKINDQHGHLVGDRVLEEFAGLIEKSIRRVDILGRYGGDEFLVILPESNLPMAEVVARRIQKNVSGHTFASGGYNFHLTCSIGLISFENMNEVDQKLFIEKIDQALLQAKRAQKNQIVAG